jgi:hypothetical protein
MKQQADKDKVYQYIIQTHRETLKQYLDLAPRLNPQILDPKNVVIQQTLSQKNSKRKINLN